MKVNRTRENCRERMKMVLPVFNPPFSQPNQQKKRKRRGHQSDKKKDRVATERRKQQREWDFMV
jgi:hypothetical protein